VKIERTKKRDSKPTYFRGTIKAAYGVISFLPANMALLKSQSFSAFLASFTCPVNKLKFKASLNWQVAIVVYCSLKLFAKSMMREQDTALTIKFICLV
jgi:hypothetical protein